MGGLTHRCSVSLLNKALSLSLSLSLSRRDDDDDVYYYIRWRLKLEGETENMGVCTKERKGVTAAVLMAAPCTNSLGGESGGQKHEGHKLARLLQISPPHPSVI